MNVSNADLPSVSRRAELAALVLIFLAAAVLRLTQLADVPPGLTHDEAGHGHDAIAILNGARPIYLTVGYGREPLYDYVNAAAMSLLGPTALTMRLTSAFAGLLLIGLVYLFARRAFGVPAALAAAALIAVSFWPVAISRQALRSTLLPMLFTGALLAFWYVYSRRVESLRSIRIIGASIAFALLVAATLYTYLPARVLWISFVVFLIYLAIFHRPDFRRLVAPALAGLAVAGLLAWPLFDYLATHPGAEARLSMLDAPLQALGQGDLSVVWNNAVSAVAAWFVPGRGDNFLAYTIRGRPVFDPVTFVLFLIGLVLCVRNLRRSGYAFLLIWFAVGVSPSLLTGSDASLTRSIGALPVFYILPGPAVAWIAARLRRLRAVGAAFALLVVLTGATTARDYFDVWGQSADVRAAYQHTVTEIAAAMRDVPGDVVVSTVYPIAPHDPYVAQVALSRDQPPFRWFAARAALVFPARAATLVIPASTPPDPYWRDLIGQPAERVALRAGDLDPYFDVYHWDAVDAARRALARVTPLAHNFGDAVQLIGVDVRTPQVAASGAIEVVTFWRVLEPERAGPRQGPANVTDAVLFTHALDAGGALAGQQDALDAPSWSWQAGDVIAQIHRFALETPASGRLSLEVGIYDRASGARLPLIVDGQAAGDSVIVGTVEVTP